MEDAMTQARDVNTEGKVVDEAIVQSFKGSLRGELIRPGDDKYDESRRVVNARIDKYPALIVRCGDTSDVVNSINFARTHDLLVAMRGGAHNVAGTGVCDGGLLRSEEHTSELQSLAYLVCRLLLEKKT